MKPIETQARISIKTGLLLILSGILIGGGAILPGISGGVLCVIFGIYRPMMSLLSRPKQAIPKYWRMFIYVGIGWLAGFLLFAKVVDLMFTFNEMLSVWLFIGLIIGTVPSLWKEAGEQGRTKGSYISFALALVLVFALLFWIRISPDTEVEANWLWYIFCGILWGISLIVPGMSSSSILISLGLYQPLAKGIAELDLMIISFWLVGLIATVAVLAKLVNYLFEKHFSIAFHAVVGVVLASTFVIVPTEYLTVSCFTAGVIVAWLFSRLEGRKDEAQKELDAEELTNAQS